MACSSFDKSIVFPISLLSAVFSARCGVVRKRSSLSELTVPLLSLLPFFVDFPPRTFTGKDLLRLSTTMSSLANANGEERTGNGDLLAVLSLSSVICIAVWKSSIRFCLSSRMDGSLEAPGGGWLGRRFIWTSRAHTSFSRLQWYTRSSKCKHLNRSVPVATTIKRLPCTDWTSQDFVHKAKECVFFTKTMASYNNAGTIKVLWKPVFLVAADNTQEMSTFGISTSRGTSEKPLPRALCDKSKLERGNNNLKGQKDKPELKSDPSLFVPSQ